MEDEDFISNMSVEDKAKAFDVLAENCIKFTAMMSDTFMYACADSEELGEYDLDRLAPLLVKYGNDALVAYAAVKRKAEPIDCKCNHKNDNYYAAKKEIEALAKVDEYFPGDW